MNCSKSSSARSAGFLSHTARAGIIAAAITLLGATSASGASLYPDLRMLAPTDLQVFKTPVNDVEHQFLRFTTRTANLGQGALEVGRVPAASGIADLNQRIYETPIGFRDERIGASVFGAADFTFPVPYIARYEIWTQRSFRTAQRSGFRRGRPLYEQDDVSYCVEDSEQVGPNAAAIGTYQQCTKTVTGISAGWTDVEPWYNDGQAFDLGTTGLSDGDYVLRAVADPHNILFESDGKADPARESEVANSGLAYFRFAAGQLAGVG